MKTTVPYVDRVTNIDAAASGFDAESTTALVTRAPRTLRHGGRAVAADDYEDLARLASAEVARARCVPLRRLREDPLGSVPVPGALSLIVVPGSSDPKPLPSLELLELTAEYVRARQAANADVSVVGPVYVRVDVAMEVALASIENASEVERVIRGQLAAFLHPLSGGRDGAGWDFGRKPQLSDLHAIINGVPGVDHLRTLSMSRHEDLAGAEATGRFLVYSGQHQIDFTFTGSE
jgi:predicted phage baseplate assembly protein